MPFLLAFYAFLHTCSKVRNAPLSRCKWDFVPSQRKGRPSAFFRNPVPPTAITRIRTDAPDTALDRVPIH